MGWLSHHDLPASLAKWDPEHIDSVGESQLKDEITASFEQARAFALVPNRFRDEAARHGADDAISGIIEAARSGSMVPARRMVANQHLHTLVKSAITTVLDAVETLDAGSVNERRIVIIRDRPGSPTIYHVDSDSTVLARVGQGPIERETPTIYLGLNSLELMGIEEERGNPEYFETLCTILRIEERAIETGFAHLEPIPPDVVERLDALIARLIEFYRVAPLPPLPGKPGIRPFTVKNRRSMLEMLDARVPEKEMVFDYRENLRAIDTLERHARRYKNAGDLKSLREVVRLLVAASGHDLHEVRNRANLLLERILSPREFDSPLATRFATTRAGGTYRFELDLPASRSSYFLRIFGDRAAAQFVTDQEIDYVDLELTKEGETYSAEHLFRTIGQYDWLVGRRRGSKTVFLQQPAGRISVIPDIRGQVILEIFPDIHGHSRTWWRTEHPGLVYNEHGQVIRRGSLQDVAAHLEDLRARLGISAVYLLGVQRRGRNIQDWSDAARSPSPFAPMSLTEIEESIGGSEGLEKLVAEAHRLDLKVIVDIVPHLNRTSDELPDELKVKCYDEGGNLVVRASTDGRFGSWNDGMLLNYRKFETWEWMAESVVTLVERYDIDGIRIDSAHAVPVMMQRNNYPFQFGERRTLESLVEGEIILNDREHDQFVTTGYYDTACQEIIAVPFHTYLGAIIHKKLRSRGKEFFLTLAESYWGREQQLTRNGVVPYNSALFKICEQISSGEANVEEIYRLYNSYYRNVLPPGSELLGIFGNHDEPRALMAFGSRGARATLMLTSFLSSCVLDYEGAAEGEAWRVFIDNIYVDWNQFEESSYRAMEPFYRDAYAFHRNNVGDAYLVQTDNEFVAAAAKVTKDTIWIGAFNFSDSNQEISLVFADSGLPLNPDGFYRLSDPVYTAITGQSGWFSGRELFESRIHTVIARADRIKLLKIERTDVTESNYGEFLRDSFARVRTLESPEAFRSSFIFREISRHAAVEFESAPKVAEREIDEENGAKRDTLERETGEIARFASEKLAPALAGLSDKEIEIGLKRLSYYLCEAGRLTNEQARQFLERLGDDRYDRLAILGKRCLYHHRSGTFVFAAAEAEPFSKSGGLANVLYELPRRLAASGEQVCVITPLYRQGDESARTKMEKTIAKYEIQYTGRNVCFWVGSRQFDVGVHEGTVDGVTYYLLDHHEAFDGLYWGVTGGEKLMRRTAFARACLEVIRDFYLYPMAIFTNDAFTGPIFPILLSDPGYAGDASFARATRFHIIHNCGWQYFDSYHRYENDSDILTMLNLPKDAERFFIDPVDHSKINCMAAGIRATEQVITVSPSYAEQIRYQADGLERVIHHAAGISNGVGVDFAERAEERIGESGFRERSYPILAKRLAADPGLRHRVIAHYPEVPEGFDACSKIEDPVRRLGAVRLLYKLLLQCDRGLDIDPDIPLFVMIHRITEQKGFQLLLSSSERIARTLGFQGIVGGSVSGGDQRGSELAEGLRSLGNFYPGRIQAGIGFQDVSAPLFGADVFLMPSLQEPGGISQLESMACGCFVIARATGGLRDTVRPISVGSDGRVRGNGFLFSDYTPEALFDAMERCLRFLKDSDPRAVTDARHRMMQEVYSWDNPASEYVHLVYGSKEILHP